MNQHPESNVYRDVTDFVRGSAVAVSASFAAAAVRHFARVSESRCGYVLVVGHWLVRLSEDEHGWVVQRLPQSPALAHRSTCTASLPRRSKTAGISLSAEIASGSGNPFFFFSFVCGTPAL
jgi:hypothetical protein